VLPAPAVCIGSDPRPIDVATIAALLAVLAISISRHGLAIRQARQAAERPAARLALFRVLILAAALAALPAIADGPGPSMFDPPATHSHPPGADWIMRGGLRNAAGEWCCGEGDCFMIPAEQVEERQGGYLLLGAELVPFAEAMPSRDGSFWRCKRPDGSRRCFFAPPPAT
jgi:hypothetical protein